MSIDERWQTGPVMLVLGTVWTFAANNPTEFVGMCVSIGGFIIMLSKFLEERGQRNERHKLKMELLRKQLNDE